MERRPPRYAHAEGHTHIIYTSDGSELLTCGSDGDVRVWSGLEDDDPRSVCVGEWALAVTIQDDRLYISTDNHAVQIYTYPSFDKDGIVTRFTAPVTDIALSEKHSGLICCSENMEGRLCSKDGDKWNTNTMKHQGPVLGVTVCPSGKYCMTACGDGLYRIWDLQDFSTIKEIPGIPKVNSFYSAKVLGRANFEPTTGNLLAYPSNKEIVVLDTKTWQQKFALSNSQIKPPYSICLFSPCGNYIAASNTVGQVIVWNVDQQITLGVTEHISSLNISSMAWNPTGNGELAFCDISGQLATIINCYEDKNDEASNDEDENLDLIDIIEREREDGNSNLEYPQDSEEDDENTISLRKLKNESLAVNKEDADKTIVRSRSHSRSRSRSRSPQRVIENVPAQPPFQPSSTPLNLEHRYMCWNEIGIVRCHSSEDNSNIEVEFHDTDTHHSIHLNNHLNHTLASLSSTVLVLACEAPSKIVCIALIGGSKEWSVTLADIEEVLCLTATDTLVAAATSTRLLRLFTPFGTQLHVLSLLGSPVSLSGRKGILNVMYHSADPGLHDQHLAMDVIHVQGMSVNCRRTGIIVALSISSRILWFGATEFGSPVTLDSVGMLRLYSITSNTWVPICNTANHYKGVSDTFFVIAVNETAQIVNAILCRGIHYPLTVPRPIATNLPLRLPLCEMDTEKGQNEELIRRNTVLTSSEDKENRTEIILKLFALACRSEIEQRSTEIIELLHDHQLAVLAAKYASRIGKLHLADKLTNLADSWKENIETEIIDDAQQEINESLDTEAQDLDASIILPVTKKKDVAPLKPMPFMKSSQGSKNPFRRSSSNDKSLSKNGHGNPLALTERTLVNEQIQSPAVTPRQSISSPLPTEKFPEWYEKNKEALLNEHEELTPSELTKIGVRTFKSLKLQTNAETPKRKHSPEPEELNDGKSTPTVQKQSKLAAFSFQKRNKD